MTHIFQRWQQRQLPPMRKRQHPLTRRHHHPGLAKLRRRTQTKSQSPLQRGEPRNPEPEPLPRDMARKPDKATLETKHIPEQANRLRSGRLVPVLPLKRSGSQTRASWVVPLCLSGVPLPNTSTFSPGVQGSPTSDRFEIAAVAGSCWRSV